ncbi:NUDIX domain-containing protein, partial [Corynebacterium sp. MC-20]|uniref:NUDIX domain-containing protein n=1 Tax=Corynebacterium parakroppenstedtii TaxID=2828363 RepID=UPI001F3E12A8
ALNQLWQHAEELMPENNTRAYNQGLMDLGAMLCTKTNPSCLLCPVNQFCQAYQNNNQMNYPVKALKKHRPTKTTSFLVIENSNKFILKKRPSEGIWGGLWSLPEINDYPMLAKIQHHKTTKNYTHLFSHFKLIYNFIFIETAMLEINDTDQLITIDELTNFALPKPMMAFF